MKKVKRSQSPRPPLAGTVPAASGSVAHAQQRVPHVSQLFIMSMFQVYARRSPDLTDVDIADSLDWKRAMGIDSPCQDTVWYDPKFDEKAFVRGKRDTAGSFTTVTDGICRNTKSHLAICPKLLLEENAKNAQNHLFKVHNPRFANKLVKKISLTLSYLLRHAKPKPAGGSQAGTVSLRDEYQPPTDWVAMPGANFVRMDSGGWASFNDVVNVLFKRYRDEFNPRRSAKNIEDDI